VKVFYDGVEVDLFLVACDAVPFAELVDAFDLSACELAIVRFGNVLAILPKVYIELPFLVAIELALLFLRELRSFELFDFQLEGGDGLGGIG
jgi:hypothetical protein